MTLFKFSFFRLHALYTNQHFCTELWVKAALHIIFQGKKLLLYTNAGILWELPINYDDLCVCQLHAWILRKLYPIFFDVSCLRWSFEHNCSHTLLSIGEKLAYFWIHLNFCKTFCLWVYTCDAVFFFECIVCALCVVFRHVLFLSLEQAYFLSLHCEK